MKKFSPLVIGFSSLLLLCACQGETDTTDPNGQETSSESTVDETSNVLYTGTLREAGVTIFMQGTHQLELEDGRMLLLESDDVSLNTYIGQRVEVYGAVRPTVEEGGQIMRVESIVSLEASSSSSSEESSSSESSSSASSEEEADVASSEQAVSSAAVVSSVAASSVAAAPVTSQASSAAAWEASGELSAKAAVMAKDNMAASNWTQQYCSSHIKFCIPVHKNWWYFSFGTTSSTLWHVEIGPQEIFNLGEGPISVNVVSGSATADGQVTTEGDTVVGQKALDGNRHFEVRGPAGLRAAIEYILAHIEVTAG